VALSPDREGRLTASMHGQALGCGYDSPQKAWRKWHGLEKPDERAVERMAWGSSHEADAILAFEAHSGFIADNTGDSQLWTPYEDWSGCTTDGLIEDWGVVEAKCVQALKEVPSEAHYCQVQSQLHITNRQKGYLVQWTPEETRIWLTERDATYWPTVEPSLVAYLRMLKAEKPPGRTKKTSPGLTISWERIA
jgi:hypothetical protein